MSDEIREKLVNCLAGEHEFIEIYSIEFEAEDGELLLEKINWCEVCGGVTIDVYKDGASISEELVELQLPEVLQMTQLFYS